MWLGALGVATHQALAAQFGSAVRPAGFDVLPDGQFVANISEVSAGEQPLTVVLNWPHGPRPKSIP